MGELNHVDPFSSRTAYLERALELACSFQGSCAPNPAVGCVLVWQGKIIAEGAHQGCGTPHAEAVVLKKVAQPPKGAILYSTLEPCNHVGRTPACTDAILQAGVTQVYFGHADKNTRVKGGGAEYLKSRGTECHHLPTPEISAFYESYDSWLMSGVPRVTAKIAIGWDFSYAGSGQQRMHLSSTASQKWTHAQRAKTDSILTTAKTVIADDPQLNARVSKSKILKKRVFILDRHERVPKTSRLYRETGPVTRFVESNGRLALQEPQAAHHETVVPLVSKTTQEQVYEMLHAMGAQNHDVWVEAGATFLQAWIQLGVIHKLHVLLCPRWAEPKTASKVTHFKLWLNQARLVETTSLGLDTRITFTFK